MEAFYGEGLPWHSDEVSATKCSRHMLCINVLGAKVGMYAHMNMELPHMYGYRLTARVIASLVGYSSLAQQLYSVVGLKCLVIKALSAPRKSL